MPTSESKPPKRSPRRAPSALQRWRGAIDLAGEAYAQATQNIQEFHQAIARKPFAPLQALPAIGDATTPVRVLHDGITDAVYTGVREFGAIGFATASGLVRLFEQDDDRAPVATPRTDLALSALSGLLGDHLAGRRNPLAPGFGLYRDGLRLAMDAASLRDAFPHAQSRLVIFVHGLCCNETSWQLYRKPSDPQTAGYGEQLAGRGYTPLYLRYNTGAHISQNARRLERLIDQLTVRWPLDVEEIVLVGHSMGGLVIRAAAAAGARRDAAWIKQVRELICLGSPHQGAPLEQGVHALTQLMQAFDLSRPWAKVLDVRSVGIRDLRFGATHDGDWREGLARAWRPPQPIPRLAHARYHFIGCSIGSHERDWRGHMLGDGLVRLPSALAAELADADTAVLFRRHHMQLLNDPAVYALITERLFARAD